MNARAETTQIAARMGALARLPVFYALTGKRTVVAGGSAAAAWKVELLSACGARVEVFAEAPCEELLALAVAPPGGDVLLTQRGWTKDDLAGAAIAIGAFDNDDEAGRFAAAARAAGVPVNVNDRPAFCDFSFGSIVNRSPLVIGISTDGAAPVFAQAVRTRIEALLPQGFAMWAAAASRWRALLKATGLSFAGRRKFWQLFTAQALNDPGHAPSSRDFARLVAEVETLGTAVEQGTMTFVNAGPADPELLTLRAVRALQSADAILFDDTVSPAVLDFARREASRVALRDGDDASALALDLARRGKRVVCVTSGEATALSDASLAACAAEGIALASVPGVTAPPQRRGWRPRVVRSALR
jgi:uroporphyrin-III C-methyltransferase/precorrin-2 dehydrogenase/sirohydrochlorin ferrochelatase